MKASRILPLVAAALLCLGQTARAQSWQTGLTVCEPDGSSIAVPYSGLWGGRGYYDGAMVGGFLTGSGGGSQSPSGSGYYTPGPTSWVRTSGLYLYSWADEDPPRVEAEAGDFLLNPNADSPTHIQSNGNASVNFSLYKCYLWQTWWDDADTGGPPNPATKPAPPPSLAFLLQTRLTADALDGYSPNGYNSVSSSDYTGLFSSCTVEDTFGEKVGATAPAAPDPLSGGYSYQKAHQSGGGSHLLTVPAQSVNGKTIYTISLTGDGKAVAAAAISNVGLQGDAHATATLDGYVSPISIHLSSPNPAIHPEVGNDRHRQDNQFVYGDATSTYATDQDGNAVSDPHNLCIPITVTAAGADAATMQWLKAHMHITVTPAISNAVPFDLVVSGNKITLQSRYVVFNLAYPGFGDLITYSGFLAHDLPQSNSNFGNHQITLTVDGQVIDTANVQTFFNPADCTHPVDALDPTTWLLLPNFYYYYNQVYPSPGVYNSVGPAHTIMDPRI